MPTRQRPSFLKRQKEMTRLNKQREKSEKRLTDKRAKEPSVVAEVAAGTAPTPESAEGVQSTPLKV